MGVGNQTQVNQTQIKEKIKEDVERKLYGWLGDPILTGGKYELQDIGNVIKAKLTFTLGDIPFYYATYWYCGHCGKLLMLKIGYTDECCSTIDLPTDKTTNECDHYKAELWVTYNPDDLEERKKKAVVVDKDFDKVYGLIIPKNLEGEREDGSKREKE